MVSSILSRVTRPLRSLLPNGRDEGLLAIDLSPATLHAIHIRRSGAELVLDRFRTVRLKNGKGMPLDEAFRQALELRLGNEALALALSSPDVVIRHVEFPPMSPTELREALPWEARRHIAGLAEDALLDAQVLAREGSAGPSEGVLVAFPGEFYAAARSEWTSRGLEPCFVDVGQLAAMNACLGRARHERSEPVALLALGGGIASFAIFSSQSLVLFRDLGMRLSHLDTLLGAEFALDPGQVEHLKASGKLSTGQAPAPGAVARALADVLGELTEDLRSARLYLESRSGGSLERVYWTGGDAAFLDRHDLLETLAAQSGVPLERLQPFQGMRLGLIDEIGLKAIAPELAAAAGVAARFFAGAH